MGNCGGAQPKKGGKDLKNLDSKPNPQPSDPKTNVSSNIPANTGNVNQNISQQKPPVDTTVNQNNNSAAKPID